MNNKESRSISVPARGLSSQNEFYEGTDDNCQKQTEKGIDRKCLNIVNLNYILNKVAYRRKKMSKIKTNKFIKKNHPK